MGPWGPRVPLGVSGDWSQPVAAGVSAPLCAPPPPPQQLHARYVLNLLHETRKHLVQLPNINRVSTRYSEEVTVCGKRGPSWLHALDASQRAGPGGVGREGRGSDSARGARVCGNRRCRCGEALRGRRAWALLSRAVQPLPPSEGLPPDRNAVCRDSAHVLRFSFMLTHLVGTDVPVVGDADYRTPHCHLALQVHTQPALGSCLPWNVLNIFKLISKV